MNKIFIRVVSFICRISVRYPYIFLFAAVLITVPSANNLKRLRMDTDLIRLLPDDNRVVILKERIKGIVTGSGGFFSILLESSDSKRLLEAFEAVLERVQTLEDVEAVDYENPREFIHKYRYLLVSSDDLNRVVESLLRLEAKMSPVGEDLLSEDAEAAESLEREDKREIRDMMRYLDLPKYHQSEDGRVMSFKVYPKKGVTSLGDIKALSSVLEAMIQDISAKMNVWGGLSGSLQYDLSHYDFIRSDLARSGLLMLVFLLVTLFIGFRDFRAIPVVLLPLFFGLVWAFGSIPLFTQRLNTITSFLLLISFGLGIDFSLHLVRRFQLELSEKTPAEALITTFVSSGKSVILSALTTALAFFILAFSNFRGFSEFGALTGYSIIVILLAMMVFLPAIIILGYKARLIRCRSSQMSRVLFPGKTVTIFLLAVVSACFVIGIFGLTFDYDFSHMDVPNPQRKEIEDRYYKVYVSKRSPGALFVAKGVSALDGLLAALREKRAESSDSQILRYESIRDFSPDEKETRLRFSLISEIKETVEHRWTQKVKDPDYRRLIDDINQWEPPPQGPAFDGLPEVFTVTLISKRYPDEYVVPVYIRGKKQDGKDSSTFAHELYSIPPSESVIGPFGDTTVIAEVLEIVTKEGPKLVIFAFLGIFLIIFLPQRSLSQALWMVMPLITGLAMVAGIMVILGLKLNFFNIVVFPTLIGIGVDDGVHFFRRWKEKKKDAGSTQKELFGTLYLTTTTTMCSYLAIALSRHPGLQSIGFLACLGLACTWMTTVFLLPGLLDLFYGRKEKQRQSLPHPPLQRS